MTGAQDTITYVPTKVNVALPAVARLVGHACVIQGIAAVAAPVIISALICVDGDAQVARLAL